MKNLVDGHRRFRTYVFPQKRRKFAELAEGQTPRYMIITCCDSRVDPREFTNSGPGDLFMERSIGNLVPKYGEGENEANASIEYAVTALGVEHLIICGHSRCGAMAALLDPESVRHMPTVATWLTNANETLEVVARKYGHLQGGDLLDATIRENVLIQVEHTRHLPVVAAGLEEGRLKVHGWVYVFERGTVEAYDPRVGRFVPLEAAYETGAAPGGER